MFMYLFILGWKIGKIKILTKSHNFGNKLWSCWWVSSFRRWGHTVNHSFQHSGSATATVKHSRKAVAVCMFYRRAAAAMKSFVNFIASYQISHPCRADSRRIMVSPANMKDSKETQQRLLSVRLTDRSRYRSAAGGKAHMHCCFIVKLCLSGILWINVVYYSTKSRNLTTVLWSVI